MVDGTASSASSRVGKRLATRCEHAQPAEGARDKGMDLASSDAELKARALFRLVDVVPACRSLDDLAAISPASWARSASRARSGRHADRATPRRPARARPGRRGGVNTWRSAFIVGEDPKARARRPARAVEGRRRAPRSTARRGGPSRRRGAALRRRCVDALDTIGDAARGWPHDRSSSATRPARSRARTSPSSVGAHAAVAPDAPSAQARRRDGCARCRRCARRRRAPAQRDGVMTRATPC